MGFYAWKCFKFENNLLLVFPRFRTLQHSAAVARGAKRIALFKFPWRTIWVLTQQGYRAVYLHPTHLLGRCKKLVNPPEHKRAECMQDHSSPFGD
jgi:hypothetical protein